MKKLLLGICLFCFLFAVSCTQENDTATIPLPTDDTAQETPTEEEEIQSPPEQEKKEMRYFLNSSNLFRFLNVNTYAISQTATPYQGNAGGIPLTMYSIVITLKIDISAKTDKQYTFKGTFEENPCTVGVSCWDDHSVITLNEFGTGSGTLLVVISSGSPNYNPNNLKLNYSPSGKVIYYE